MSESNLPPGRSLDYPVNNCNYSSFNVSYVNTETTAINLTRGEEFSQHGIRVTINIIRNDIHKRLPALIETGRESNAFKAQKRDSWKKRMGEWLVARAMRSGGSDYNKNLFNYYVRQYSSGSNTEKVFVRRFRMKRIYFERRLFDERKKLDFGGRAFWSVKDTDALLAAAYGEDFRTTEIAPYDNSRIIISTSIPFKDYLDSLQKKGITLGSVFEQLNSIRTSNLANEKIVKAVSNVMLLARMSEQRFLLYRSLHERTDEIRALREKGDYDSLTEIFKEYDRQARYFLRRGYALCPDEELFDIECELMERAGETEKAKKMRSLVFEEHKKPLTAKPFTAQSAKES